MDRIRSNARIRGLVDGCSPTKTGKRRYNIKLWKTFTDCFNCLPIAAIIDEKIFTMHGGLSPDLQSMEQIRRVMRPTDVPDTGACIPLLFMPSSILSAPLCHHRSRLPVRHGCDVHAAMLTFVLCLLLGCLVGPVACRSSVRSALVRPGQGYHRLVRER